MRTFAIAATLCLLGAANSVSADDSAKLEAIFAPLVAAGTPGVAVLVRERGQTIFARGYGVRDLASKAKIDTATNFRLASFTKQFTAMAIMLLVHDGKLRYDQTLTAIFPDFPAYGRAVTVRHLLTHTAGLPDYEDLMDAKEKGRDPIWTPDRQLQDEEVLTLLKQQPQPKFAAGSSWSYSNSAYVVLGLIVERVSAQPFGEFLRQRIFQPLAMSHTKVYLKGRNTVENRAFGHAWREGKFVQSDQSSTSATLGDGGIYSNLDDLAKWDAALANHTLLSEKEMQNALVPAKLANGSGTKWPSAAGDDNLNPGKPVAYGFGWFLDPLGAHARMWHSGTTTGFRTAIERFPQDQLTVIVLCNRTDLDATGLALKAVSAILK